MLNGGSLSAAHFNVIRQLTFEFANVKPELLEQHGWSQDLDEGVRLLVRSVPRNLDADREIRIAVVDDTTGGSGVFDGEVLTIAKRLAEVWPTLLRVTFDFLGSKEARYRTGYYEPEIIGAVDAFSAVLVERGVEGD